MKRVIVVTLFFILNLIPLSSKPDSTYWIDKGDYKEINTKIGLISFMKFSNDGKSLFTYSSDSILRKWDIEKCKIVDEYFINTNPNIIFNLSADEKKFGYTAYNGNPNNTIRFYVFNLKNEFIKSYDATGRNYKNPCPYGYLISNFGKSSFMFHPNKEQVICGTDFEINCPTDDLIFYHYWGGSFELYSADSSGQYLLTMQPGSRKGSLTFSPNGNYTVYESHSIKTTYITKEDRLIVSANYKEIIADNNFNPISVFSSQTGSNLNRVTFTKKYIFSSDSKFLSYLGNYFTVLKVPSGGIHSNWSINDMKIDTPEALAFTKDNNNLVTGSNVNGIGSIRFWDMKTKELVNYFDFKMKDMRWKFAVNKDSGYLVTASNDSIIRLFKNTSYQTIKADFSNDASDFFTNEDVVFHDISQGVIRTRFWDFGDNSTSNEKDPNHKYSKSGKYLVKLIVSNGVESDTTHKLLNVVDKIPNSNYETHKWILNSNISITPNPATDYIEIIIPPLERWSGDVSLFDVLGIKHMDSRLRGNDIFVSSEGNVRINVSSLSPGVYFVRIGEKVQKFVKM